jgi:uncharacterized membrane protein YjjP (DUF1212 family)
VYVIIAEVVFFLFGAFCIAAAVLSIYHLSTYLYRRWGQVPSVVVTGLAFFPLLMGGWMLFYTVWMIGWVSKRTRRSLLKGGG